MDELRKDPLLDRWVAIRLLSLQPEEYGLGHEEPQDGDCPLCAITDDDVVESGPNGVTVVLEKTPLLHCNGELGRRAVGMYDAMNCIGSNEYIIESKDHATRPEDISLEHMASVLLVYAKRLSDLEDDSRMRYALIYKNSGARAGAHFLHPHALLTATPIIPRLVKAELDGAKQYYAYKERCIFCDVMAEERRKGERVILETEHFVAFCPYASKMPFEFWIVPKRHNCAYQQISPEELKDLAGILSAMLRRMRKLLREPAFNYFLHTAPNRMPRRDHWHTLGDDYHWHIEVIPRLRTTTGLEWGSDFFILATSPEDAAQYYREV